MFQNVSRTFDGSNLRRSTIREYTHARRIQPRFSVNLSFPFSVRVCLLPSSSFSVLCLSLAIGNAYAVGELADFYRMAMEREMMMEPRVWLTVYGRDRTAAECTALGFYWKLQPINRLTAFGDTVLLELPLNCIVTECLQKCIRSTLPLCCHKHEAISQSVDQLDPQRHERNVMNIKRREKKHRNINYFNHTYIDYNMLFLSGNFQQFHSLFFVLFFFFFLFSKYYTSLLVSIGLS